MMDSQKLDSISLDIEKTEKDKLQSLAPQPITCLTTVGFALSAPLPLPKTVSFGLGAKMMILTGALACLATERRSDVQILCESLIAEVFDG